MPNSLNTWRIKNNIYLNFLNITLFLHYTIYITKNDSIYYIKNISNNNDEFNR
jgi:hypothetical protein